jgi:hypothetical protein
MDARAAIAEALDGTGINLIGACGIAAYDARAPIGLQSSELMSRARGVVGVGRAGRALWSGLRADVGDDPGAWADRANPLDSYVARLLDRADEALARARVGSRRFDPTIGAQPALDFRALGEIVGLGALGPFGLLIHREHGPWWALRGAWLVDVEVADPELHVGPCVGCHAPCIEPLGPASERTDAIALATPEARARCILGQGSRYSDEQTSYHYDRESTRLRLRASYGERT